MSAYATNITYINVEGTIYTTYRLKNMTSKTCRKKDIVKKI